MATWHQQQTPYRLYHDTEWTVVSDPPNQVRTLSTFTTEAGARTAMAKWKAAGEEHLYILPPAKRL